MKVCIKRIYEPYSSADGYRVLVDRLWPRGVKKETAHIDLWLKEIAPSTELRKWFHHEASNWSEFVKQYKLELRGSSALKELKALTKAHTTVTLLYGAKDEENNQAVVLQKMMKPGG